jgi:hypothetical protein
MGNTQTVSTPLVQATPMLFFLTTKMYDLDLLHETSTKKKFVSKNLTTDDNYKLQQFILIKNFLASIDPTIIVRRLDSYLAKRISENGYFNLDSGRWKTELKGMYKNNIYRMVSTDEKYLEGIVSFLNLTKVSSIENNTSTVPVSPPSPSPLVPKISWEKTRKLVWEKEFQRLKSWGYEPPSNGTLKCFCCLKQVRLAEEYQCCHLRPRAHGGEDVVENLRVGCKTCNTTMGTIHAYEFMYINNSPGLVLVPNDDPIKKNILSFSRLTYEFSRNYPKYAAELTSRNTPEIRLEAIRKILSEIHV